MLPPHFRLRRQWILLRIDDIRIGFVRFRAKGRLIRIPRLRIQRR